MLIYSHCPVQPQWQLLEPVVARSRYEQFPLVKSGFFTAGMRFLGHDRGIVCTRRGVTTVNLGLTRPTALTFRLTHGETAVSRVQVRSPRQKV